MLDSISQAQMLITDGGVGDLIAELVPAAFNITQNPDTLWTVFIPDYLEDLANHLLPKPVNIIAFSRGTDVFRHDLKTVTTKWLSGHTPMRTHPVDYGFHMLCDRHMSDLSKKNYLRIRRDFINISRFQLPSKYVCIAASGAEPVKTLPGSVIDKISDALLSWDYEPVFLGKKEAQTGVAGLSVKSYESGADLRNGVNLMDETNLIEAAAIIDKSAAFVCMDGGLMHLAGCTGAQMVCGFTLVSPQQVAPFRNNSQGWRMRCIEPDANIPNRYYQSTCSVIADGDLRKFPGWESVLANLTAEKFIRALKNIL